VVGKLSEELFSRKATQKVEPGLQQLLTPQQQQQNQNRLNRLNRSVF
jgi:hypothetical protein